jgi:hypothetical protein
MKKKRAGRKQKLAALKKECDRELLDMIRRLMDRPIEQRTHFLRKRVTYTGSTL